MYFTEVQEQMFGLDYLCLVGEKIVQGEAVAHLCLLSLQLLLLLLLLRFPLQQDKLRDWVRACIPNYYLN